MVKKTANENAPARAHIARRSGQALFAKTTMRVEDRPVAQAGWRTAGADRCRPAPPARKKP
ncbi:hypothetical protein WS96_03685 [Burkholderia sp. MSMB1835]|nr:hypothetical protein WS96_03685 [Burkholderia sp. MSMB1835]KWE55727.1 hypothetical protein WT53_25475 [Burkholderia sp. MSMB2157WGS]